MTNIQVVSLVGLLLSVYAYYVEVRVQKDASYKAICDLNNRVSCTRVLKSGYGHMFGISNAIPGMIFYLMMFALSGYGLSMYLFWLALASFLFSIYLGYILYFKVKSFCLICNGIYLVNVILLVLSYIQYVE